MKYKDAKSPAQQMRRGFRLSPDDPGAVFLHEQRGEDRNQGNDRCALDGGDGVGHVLGDGIHCFFLRMNYYLVWLDISTNHLQSQACLRIKFIDL